MNNEKLTEIVSGCVSKYEGQQIKDVLDKLRDELNDVLNHYLTDNYVVKDDFPIMFENEIGKWEIHSDGNAYVWPKKSAAYIECNITIKPSGDADYE